MKRLELKVEGEAFKDKRFSVPAAGLRLGRSSSNDIVIRDEELSRNHCLFEPVGESGVRITDLASANGTFLNEQRLGAMAVELKAGDVIRIGKSFVTVVGEEPRVDFDLGLGDRTSSAALPSAGPAKPAKKRAPLANILWGVVILVLAGAGALLLLQPSVQPEAQAQALADAQPILTELRYEKIAADSNGIFRYDLSLTPDGVLHVAIDDLTGENRNISRNEPLGDEKRAQLLEILSDDAFQALDGEYTGPEEDPPRLNSWMIRYYTTTVSKRVTIVNTQEPEAFRRVRERLEAFSMNEFRIRALQYSREKLLEMAHEAADTGRMKWEDRDVECGNIHASICAYREAMADLETVNPKPPEFETYREALERATRELDARCKNQNFIIDQARSVGDWQKARTELRTLCEMIPDREDARNREACKTLIDVEKRLGKKGGRP